MALFKFTGKRSERGSALALSTSVGSFLIGMSLVAVLIVLLVLGFMQAKMAADAGTLNVGKEAPTVTVDLSVAELPQYYDVAQGGTKISLTNINRAWGKAILAMLNAEQMLAITGYADVSNMINTGNITGNLVNGLQGSAHEYMDAMVFYNQAVDISNRLALALRKADNLKGFYLNFAQANPISLLGVNAVVQMGPPSNWAVSYLDRGRESNISVDPLQLPAWFLSSAQLHLVSANGQSFLPGYKGINILGIDFFQVPAPSNTTPHLVSESTFVADANPNTMGWSTAVPNAFGTEGTATVATAFGTRQQALFSFAEENPQTTYKMAMPGNYVCIHLDINELIIDNDFVPDAVVPYGFTPGQTYMSPGLPLPCGYLTGTATVGNEFMMGPTLLSAAFGPLSAETALAPGTGFTFLWQRIQEISPGYNLALFLAELAATPINPAAVAQDYIIFLPPGAGPNAPLMIAPLLGPLPFIFNRPDGTQIMTDLEIAPVPNFGETMLFCYGEYDYPSVSLTERMAMWTPGTGLGGCLGTLEVSHSTMTSNFGFCSCPGSIF